MLAFLFSCQERKALPPAIDATKVKVNGSSTVYPITAGVIEKYRFSYNDLRFTIGVAGTGGGFKKFAAKKTLLNNASRLIKDKEKVECEKNEVDYFLFDIAYDGIAVVVNIENDWVDYLTITELRKIWRHNGAIKWSEVRDGWPEEKIVKLGPGDASGTYDYFKKAVLKEDTMSQNYLKSENDFLLIEGVKDEKNAITFFGLGYYKENKRSLKLVSIDNGSGPIKPTNASIAEEKYQPLSRKLYVYVERDFCLSSKGKQFMSFYMDHAKEIVEQTGYVPLVENTYQKHISLITKI